MMSPIVRQPGSPRRALVAAGVVGFALGGFFDGILLHQVLQWHHFLSLLPGERWRDLRQQVLADGLFHVAVYLVASLGLFLLWRARGEAAGAGRHLLGAAALGFALWQAVDIVGFHWIVGIHRVRVGVEDPLLWDIGWLVATGLPPLLLAWWLFRRPGGTGGGRAAMAGLAALVLLAAPVASLPQPGAVATLVLFRPGLGAERAMMAALDAGARVVASDASGELLLLDMKEGSTWQLFRRGAVLVGSSAASGGCLAWSRAVL